MSTKEILTELKSLGNEKTFAQNIKAGASEKQFGVKLGDIRKIAKKIKLNHKLALELWKTENIDARMLSTLIINPTELTYNEMDTITKTTNFVRVADWLNSYVIKYHPDSEKLRIEWLKSNNPMAARAGWNLTCIRVKKPNCELNLSEILNYLENNMKNAPSESQWTMNFTLVEIGINHPKYRKRVLEIGEKLGVYRDYPTSKGCTSPFAPIWVQEMVRRQK